MEILELKNRFNELFGSSRNKIYVFSAPGRVNLIGEHVDYCGGYVFPAALTLGNTVLVRRNNSNIVRLTATDLSEMYSFNLDNIDEAKSLKWGNYQAGVAKEMMLSGIKIQGCDMLFHSTLPFGSGLSSSASIETASAMAFYTLSGRKTDRKALIQFAKWGQKAENNFCGVNCGIMDQFASCNGLKDHAILLDCAKLEFEHVPLKLGKYCLVLANTCKKHALGASKYNERRQEVELGLKLMHEYLPLNQKDNLCDYTPEELKSVEDKFSGNELIYKRITHVINENQRVKDAVTVLKKGDLESFAKLMCEANESIRYLYEVTGFELDTMYDEAMKRPECLGARMTGGGFGGCTVNLVESDKTDVFCKEVGAAYEKETGIKPCFYICDVGDGVKML